MERLWGPVQRERRSRHDEAPDPDDRVHPRPLADPAQLGGLVARYESRGYRVLAPSWPGLEGEVEALNRDPVALTRARLRGVADHYERIIRGLESPPIIIGHSLGATMTQLLLDRGLGAAGVGVASGAVKGIRDLPLSTLARAVRCSATRSTAARRRR